MNSGENAPGLTYFDQEFLQSPQARQVRMLAEIVAPEQRFAKEGVENTIVFFGSARSVPMAEAKDKLEALEEMVSRMEMVSEENQAQLERARMHVKLSRYHEDAIRLAYKFTEWSNQIVQKEKRFVVASGGGPGMMEAANKGAADAGGPSIGLNISLPFEQEPNRFQTAKVSFEFHYFFIRKFWFAYLAKALLVFPGGFGTMDEMFELLTLIQTEKLQKKIPIILFGKEFWNDFFNIDALLKWQVISEKDLDLFTIVDDVDEAFELVKDALTEEYL